MSKRTNEDIAASLLEMENALRDTKPAYIAVYGKQLEKDLKSLIVKSVKSVDDVRKLARIAGAVAVMSGSSEENLALIKWIAREPLVAYWAGQPFPTEFAGSEDD